MIKVPTGQFFRQRDNVGLKTEAGVSLKEIMNAFFGETDPLRRLMESMNWWYMAACLGFLAATVNLVLINNPDICYLYAQSQIRGFEFTLPEAMAAVSARSWFALILLPFFYTLAFSVSGLLIYQISSFLKGKGNFNAYFGMIVIAAFIFILGQLIGYILIGAWNIRGLVDLRDLTPGVGLGLLPQFTVERVGAFNHELIRGFDLFGIWLVVLSTVILNLESGFNRLKSFCLVLAYYGVFLALRWFCEGPGYRLMLSFLTPGSI